MVVLFKLSEITEPEYFSKEDEFRDFIEKIVYAILDDLKERNIITNYRILRDFGFDLAIFIDKSGLPVVKFLELKIYKGQRAGGVGFGNQRGEGPQVEVLMGGKDTLTLFNKFLRWLLFDALTPKGGERYIFFDNFVAKKCAMGEVRKGKQNNFNINKLRKYAITWDELLDELNKFLSTFSE